MILFHDVVEILHLTDGDSRAMVLVRARDRRCIGHAAINGERLGPPVAADRLLQGGVLDVEMD